MSWIYTSVNWFAFLRLISLKMNEYLLLMRLGVNWVFKLEISGMFQWPCGFNHNKRNTSLKLFISNNWKYFFEGLTLDLIIGFCFIFLFISKYQLIED